MTCTILFFSTLKEVIGSGALTWELAGPTPIGELFADLSEQYPLLKPWQPSLLMAINQAYVPATTLVEPGDEVAFMPPVQGG